MDLTEFFVYLAVMAGVTYAIRTVPLVLFKHQVKSRFFRSFLAYVPYAVLGAMTFPAIFYSTGHLRSAVGGTAVALVLAFCQRGLLTVAVGACTVAFLLL